MATLDLTTLARLKTYAKIGAGAVPVPAATDDVLSSIITYVSQKFEQYCSRGFKVEPEVESRIMRGTLFPVFRNPVASIAYVKAATSGRRTNLVTLASTQYEISPDGNSIRVWDLPAGSLVEVSYTGGVAADTAAVIASHPVLEGACKMQAVNLWQRHSSPDKTGLTVVSGETHWEGQYEMLKDVKHDLDQNYNNKHRFL